MCTPDIFLAVLAILFPPVAVWIKVGVCSADSLINIALCCLGYVPGLLHAWYIILKHPEPDDEYPDGYQPIVGSGVHRDSESGRVTYYYVTHQGGQHPQPQRSYGAASNGPESRPAPLPPQNAQHNAETGQGSSSRPEGDVHNPPTYAEAVKGDNKVQAP